MRKTGEKRAEYYPTKGDKDIILVLKKVKVATVKEVASKANLNISTSYKVLGKLRDKGLVTEARPKRSNKHYAKCYELTELGEKFSNGLSHLSELGQKYANGLSTLT